LKNDQLESFFPWLLFVIMRDEQPVLENISRQATAAHRRPKAAVIMSIVFILVHVGWSELLIIPARSFNVGSSCWVLDR
jgi:hypothetical protein